MVCVCGRLEGITLFEGVLFMGPEKALLITFFVKDAYLI
jgi:hypothetical protein